MALKPIAPMKVTFKDQSNDDWKHVMHTYYAYLFKVGEEIFIDGDIYTILFIQLDIKAGDLSMEITLKFG